VISAAHACMHDDSVRLATAACRCWSSRAELVAAVFFAHYAASLTS